MKHILLRLPATIMVSPVRICFAIQCGRTGGEDLAVQHHEYQVRTDCAWEKVLYNRFFVLLLATSEKNNNELSLSTGRKLLSAFVWLLGINSRKLKIKSDVFTSSTEETEARVAEVFGLQCEGDKSGQKT
jgi:hypothetical protein